MSGARPEDVSDTSTRTPVVASLWRYDTAAVEEMAHPHVVQVREAKAGVSTADLVGDADVVLADPSGARPLGEAEIAVMRRCRLIQQPSVGVDTIDVAAATARGIPVANAAGANSRAVAEWVVMAAVTVLRDAHRAHLAMAGGDWPDSAPGRELGSQTVGLVGMGAVARAVAELLVGFGSTILFHHHRPLADPPRGTRQVPLDELLGLSDVVSLHVPLTGETQGMLAAVRLALMKPDAVLINASRGPVVDEAALAGWLAGDPRRRVAMDVYHSEPLPAGSPLRGSAQVLLSPHIAARTVDARRRLGDTLAQNIRCALSGQEIAHRVDRIAEGAR